MFQLMVADLGSPSYFVATAAVSLGFFEKEGVKIERVDGTLRGTEALKDRTLHFFGGPAFAPVQSFSDFEGVRLLCALSKYSYWFMGIRADLRVERGDMNAIKGLRISSSRSWPGQGLHHLLSEAGIDLERDNVRIVNSPSAGRNQRFRGSDGFVAIRQGMSDAFWGNGMRLEMGVRSGLAKLHLDLRRGDGPPGARLYNFAALMTTERLIDERPDIAAGAVRAIVKTQQALKADPSLAAQVGKQVFPQEETELITGLVERDAPFYDADISQEAVAGLNRFCVARGLLSKPVPYDQMVATEFRDLWNG
jgi:ABC-type nitrate/sulfonate/bicarbonate transport system substrate-binding protein